MPRLFAPIAGLILTACASMSEPGWRGQDAEPFDQALAACQAETSGQTGAALEACMARRGWIRPERSGTEER